MKKIVKPRRIKTQFPPVDNRIRVRKIQVFADTPMGEVVHTQEFAPVVMLPDDSLQLTWNYKGIS